MNIVCFLFILLQFWFQLAHSSPDPLILVVTTTVDVTTDYITITSCSLNDNGLTQSCSYIVTSTYSSLPTQSASQITSVLSPSYSKIIIDDPSYNPIIIDIPQSNSSLYPNQNGYYDYYHDSNNAYNPIQINPSDLASLRSRSTRTAKTTTENCSRCTKLTERPIEIIQPSSKSYQSTQHNTNQTNTHTTKSYHSSPQFFQTLTQSSQTLTQSHQPYNSSQSIIPNLSDSTLSTNSTKILYSATGPATSTCTGSIFSTITTDSTDPLFTATGSSSDLSVSISTQTLSTNITVTTSTNAVVETTISSEILVTSIVLTTSTTSSESESVSLIISTSTSTSESASTSTSTVSSNQSLSESTTTSTSESVIISTTLSTSTSTSQSTITTTTLVTSTSISQSIVPTSTVLDTDKNWSGDLFQVIDTSDPPSIFPRQQLPIYPNENIDNADIPIGTNKFYTNLIIGEGNHMVWTHPYGLWLENTFQNFYGWSISHIERDQITYGPININNAASYYINPAKIASIVLTADAFENGNIIKKLSNIKDMSLMLSLSTSADSSNYIDIPLAQGQGFITAIYHGNYIPFIKSQIGFQTILQEPSTILSDLNILKYRATLYNSYSWFIYLTFPSSISNYPYFELSYDETYEAIRSPYAVDGLVIQIAKAPSTSSNDYDSFYDQSAGTYISDCEVSADYANSYGTYRFTYQTEGNSISNLPMVFAFPHHYEAFTQMTSSTETGISLMSTVKGLMYAYLTDVLEMQEYLESIDIGFLPWSRLMSTGEEVSYYSEQISLIAEIANNEMAWDITESVAHLSTYFAGKYVDKYAYILLVAKDIIGDNEFTLSTLNQLKAVFQVFLDNSQFYPLMYDTLWKGVTSTSSQDGDSSTDFGGAFYNDHHFHYGYYIHAAAVIGYVDNAIGDGTWVQENKDWVNALIRDVANPSWDDTYFPKFRMFDWFSGHSWASGLFEATDGKNQESSSEDYNFAYGMKLWGQVIGDHSMQYRGDLMLQIMKRSMNMYMLYTSDNYVEPSNFIGNKVSGILFDNKVDHTTYFGTNREYIHGIHMLPITPVSSLIRSPAFVSEEWNSGIGNVADSISTGWKGILKMNQALFDPTASYQFFSSDEFTDNYLDDGESRTWSLAYAAGIMNSL
ncbi:glucan endo-1,3-beta-D-glucosidase [Ascoidea rubescens DSM 1968]|uniref:glucan endo-1,3-beta-D-glucosidase n=1 Tax=Ascoidea rubescens DSM 1968 TaxID=1344418 RepID=A0A1D2V9Y0_9ASCO|nr:glycoside hydrolase family 81 protein [Ascoidea rubescens DSM 1968]ODV58389.1 glycoside hydrolase family 81 protein [Ascoidea rubescens DSM 1968]